MIVALQIHFQAQLDIYASGNILSQTAGLEFRVVDEKLRIFIAKSGLILPTPREHAARAEQEAARADQEAARAEEQAARAAALEREVAALRAAGPLPEAPPLDTGLG